MIRVLSAYDCKFIKSGAADSKRSQVNNSWPLPGRWLSESLDTSITWLAVDIPSLEPGMYEPAVAHQQTKFDGFLAQSCIV